MPLAQDETVALWPVRILGIVAKYTAEIQGDGNLHAGQRARWMAGPCRRRASNDLFTDALGPKLQVGKSRFLFYGWHSWLSSPDPTPRLFSCGERVG